MKFILLAIFVLFAAQPLPAPACDMHDGPETTDAPAGNLQEGPMDHGDQAMDCCDQDPETPGDGCDPLSHCGACPTGLAGLVPSTTNVMFDSGLRFYVSATGAPLSRTGSPPFRPPIV